MNGNTTTKMACTRTTTITVVCRPTHDLVARQGDGQWTPGVPAVNPTVVPTPWIDPAAPTLATSWANPSPAVPTTWVDPAAPAVPTSWVASPTPTSTAAPKPGLREAAGFWYSVGIGGGIIFFAVIGMVWFAIKRHGRVKADNAV